MTTPDPGYESEEGSEEGGWPEPPAEDDDDTRAARFVWTEDDLEFG